MVFGGLYCLVDLALVEELLVVALEAPERGLGLV